MSGYHFQAVEHDASIAVESSQTDDGTVEIEVAAGSCVTVLLPLDIDTARGFLAALVAAIDQAGHA